MKMKKIILLTLSTLLIGSSLILTSCDRSSSNSTSGDSTTISSSITEEKNKPFVEKEKKPRVDYVSQLKFNENSGRKYRVIKNVKLLIDGDTSHFYLNEYKDFPESSSTYTDGIIKVRYLGIDTPESTGQVEEWGKTASKFNKSKLENAESIIVESDNGSWNADSTGSRFLCYVWYRETATSPYRNLNLEILQEGLSFAKNLLGLNSDYSDIFSKAYTQANEQELYVFSKAATSWTLNSNMNIIDNNGWVVGTKTDTESIISFDRNNLSSINALKIFKNKSSTDETKVLAKETEIKTNINNAEFPAYYLGVEVDGKNYFYTGKVDKGLGEITSDASKAIKVYIDKDSTKTAYCYNIYTEDENEKKHYVTINSSNNLDFMERDENFYYGQFQEVSIKALRAQPESFSGVLVRVEGVITRVSGQTFYIQQEDIETGLTFGMAIYMGYNFNGSSLVVVGNKLSVCGNFSNDSDYGAQISGLKYFRTNPNHPKNTNLISKNNTFTIREITGDDMNNTTPNVEYDNLSLVQTMLNTTVTLKNLTVNRVYTTGEQSSSAGAMTLTCTDSNGKEVSVRTEVLYKEDGKTKVTENDVKGKTIDIKGLVDSYNGSYQVRIYSWADISVK